jgi:hypothetical protein
MLNGACSLFLIAAPDSVGKNTAGGAQAVDCEKDREQLVRQGCTLPVAMIRFLALLLPVHLISLIRSPSWSACK